jgi:hypothetical protein
LPCRRRTTSANGNCKNITGEYTYRPCAGEHTTSAATATMSAATTASNNKILNRIICSYVT